MIAAHFSKPVSNMRGRAIADLTLTVILQVFGVASLWGYSDILGLRKSASGETTWRSITIVFMFLSALRVISVFYFSNRPSVPKFILAIKDPAYGLRQYDSGLVSTIGIMYGLMLDFVLQVLGTAALWGGSEIVGLRDDTNRRLWGSLTGVWSCISFTRYIWRAYKVLSSSQPLKNPTHWPVGIIDNFGTSFCSLQASLYLWYQWTPNSEYQPITTTAPAQPPSVASPANVVDMTALFTGWLLHLLLRGILQVLGAGGAVWGIAEVLTLRSTPDDPIFVVLSLLVITLSLIYYLVGVFEKCVVPVGRGRRSGLCIRDSGLQGGHLQLSAITTAPDSHSSLPMLPSSFGGPGSSMHEISEQDTRLEMNRRGEEVMLRDVIVQDGDSMSSPVQDSGIKYDTGSLTVDI